MTQLFISKIIIDDPAFYLRDLDPATVSRYAEDIDRLPAIEVWQDDNLVYLVDGRHRLEAHLQRARDEIGVVYFEGSRPEAEARARAANLTHALPLTAAQRRQARVEILERLYEYSNNWLAQDYMACSPNTVAALRESLEEAGQIPHLNSFKSRDGSTQPRRHDQDDDEAEPGANFDHATEDLAGPGEEAVRLSAHAEAGSGGYDDIEVEEAPAVPTKRGGSGEFEGGDIGGGEPGDGRARNAAVKLAQLGEPLAVEVLLYVDGQPASIPVTMLIAEGAISGVEEAAPGFSNVLVLGRDLAGELGLWM
jgi:hypothetical protein